MQRWRGDASGRCRSWFAWALLVLAHVALVATMLRSPASRDRPADSRVEATILLRPAPPTRAVTRPLPPPRETRLRSIPHVDPDPRTIRAPAPEGLPFAQAASAPEPPASAASQPPLNLTLTREQLRAVIAGSKPTLAQSLARGPAPSALSQIGGDDSYSEKALPGGETEVHVHGGCFKMVPTPAAKADPFNHGGALPGNCN